MTEVLPHLPGVYLFFNSQGALLYVGKSIDLRNRVLSYFTRPTPAHRRKKLADQISQIRHITTGGELAALLLESYLIKKLKPLYNRLSRRIRQLIVLKRAFNPKGYPLVLKEHLSEIYPHEFQNILGIFKSIGQAKTFLEEKVEALGLCPRLLSLEKSRAGPCFSFQVKKCRGGCIQEDALEDYQERFERAFEQRRIQAWPYAGPILIEEENRAQQKSQCIVDQWCLLQSTQFDWKALDLPLGDSYFFDYDSYKILLKFLLFPSKQSKIRVLPSLNAEDGGKAPPADPLPSISAFAAVQ